VFSVWPFHQVKNWVKNSFKVIADRRLFSTGTLWRCKRHKSSAERLNCPVLRFVCGESMIGAGERRAKAVHAARAGTPLSRRGEGLGVRGLSG